MFGRILALVGGLAGAATLSQYPEFSQQYTQRLAGQLQALGDVVADFDASAERAGLTRDAALMEMAGTAFLEDRRSDLERTITRFEALEADYTILSHASPFEKLLMPHRLGDAATLRGTWTDFEPGVPLTTAGAVATGTGFLGGYLALNGLLWLITAPFRLHRRPPKKAVYHAVEPPLTKPQPILPANDTRKPALRATRDLPR